ncbi:hypothetical protein [Verrucomicrobium sp. BvORR106]|uniref:hypothetical protein n=1 Tax=Verrucomicrobium sp. BvORR106 TaxID=1403819 RepID=UPI00056F3517|nr:hypothetical protein [Verrucomicrobium sp. BvORR106]
MTVRQSVNDLLGYLTPEQRTIPAANGEDDPLPACLAAINGALTELATLGPLWQFRARRGARIYSPTTVTIPTLTAGQSTFTLDGPWQDWMLGCSIQLPGDPWNEIVSRSGTTVTLLHPIVHSAGSNVSAIVFCDCVTAGSDVLQVLRPVAIADGHELSPVNNLSDLQASVYQYWPQEDYGRMTNRSTAVRRTGTEPAPRFYWADTNYVASAVATASRIRLGPMPNAEMILHFRARISPPQYTIADVHSGPPGYTDPGTNIPLRPDLVETIFQPIARQRFTGSPLFRNDNAVGEIKRQYEAAYAIARQMRPQGASGVFLQPGH